MENKKIIIKKDDIQLEEGKVVFKSEDLANLIQDKNFDVSYDEEIGLFACGCNYC